MVIVTVINKYCNYITKQPANQFEADHIDVDNTVDDSDDRLDDDGPDIDALIDKMVTLTPDATLPSSMPGDEPPPILPPKKSRRQPNGTSLLDTVGNGVAVPPTEGNAGPTSPPPPVPRRDKTQKDQVNKIL